MHKVAQLLKVAAETIRKQEKDNEELRAKLAQYRKTEEFRKLASEMSNLGFISPSDIDRKAEELKNSGKDINLIREAMQLALKKQASIISGTIPDTPEKADPYRQLWNSLLNTTEEEYIL